MSKAVDDYWEYWDLVRGVEDETTRRRLVVRAVLDAPLVEAAVSTSKPRKHVSKGPKWAYTSVGVFLKKQRRRNFGLEV